MGYYCTVPQCTSLAGKTKNVKFHRFPRNPDLASKWNNILKRGKPFTQYSKVCSLHFTKADYNVTAMGQWKTLNKDAIPTQNLPKLNPDGTVMVIRKSRTVKTVLRSYKDAAIKNDEDEMSKEQKEKWPITASLLQGSSNIPMTKEAPDNLIPCRQSIQDNVKQNKAVQILETQTPAKPTKQDAIMQTDPFSSEDESQFNNSFSDNSNSFQSEMEHLKMLEDKVNYPKYETQIYRTQEKDFDSPKNYTKVNEPVQSKKESYEKLSEYSYQKSFDNGDVSTPNEYENPASNYTETDLKYENAPSNYTEADLTYDNPGSNYTETDSNYKNSNYTDTESRYENPTSNYTETEIKYENPASNYTEIDPKYDNPASNFTEIESKYENPASNYTEIDPKYDNPASNYTEIDPKYDNPASNYTETDSNYDKQDSFVSFHNNYSDTVEILRNQQHNLQMLQERTNEIENQTFYNENIKEEIEISLEEEQYVYDSKDPLTPNELFSNNQNIVGEQIKSEPIANVCNNESQGNPFLNGNNIGVFFEQYSRQPGPELLIAKQNALSAHTQLWQNMKRPFFYSDSPHYNGTQLIHRYEDLSRILQ